MYRMIYQHDCHNLNIKYFDNLIQVNIKDIPNNIVRFKLYEDILQIFKLYECNILVKYYDSKFLIYNERDLKQVLRTF